MNEARAILGRTDAAVQLEEATHALEINQPDDRILAIGIQCESPSPTPAEADCLTNLKTDLASPPSPYSACLDLVQKKGV